VFDIFEKLNREQGQTLVIVTHDLELASRARRVVRIREGRIEGEEGGRPAPDAGRERRGKSGV